MCFKFVIAVAMAAGVFGVMYDGYLSNAEDDPEGAVPVIIKTVKGTHHTHSHTHTFYLSTSLSQRTHPTLW